MLRWLGLWLLRILAVLAAIALVAYAADWTVYKLRGSPQSSVKVSRFLDIPLKANRVEYDYLGAGYLTCTESLFPHNGQDACWHLRRYPNQWE